VTLPTREKPLRLVSHMRRVLPAEVGSRPGALVVNVLVAGRAEILPGAAANAYEDEALAWGSVSTASR